MVCTNITLLYGSIPIPPKSKKRAESKEDIRVEEETPEQDASNPDPPQVSFDYYGPESYLHCAFIFLGNGALFLVCAGRSGTSRT
jgi:hypothetical protein